MHFGATLRLLRVDAGLTLRALARRIGVSSAYLSRVENGHDPAPTPDRLIAIADALGLPRAVMVELAQQAGPAVAGYLDRVPEASTFFLDIARRDFRGPQIARIKAFIDAEFPEPHAGVQPALLSDLLTESRIVLHVSCPELEDLIAIAAARMGDDLDPRHVLERVMARERESPTTFGGGFVAPHAAIDGARDAAVLLTLSRPLAVATPDEQPLRIAFVVIGGSDRACHLQILARVARLASYNLVDDLCAADTPARARSIIAQVESLW
jgi:PTS system nitrogen regulatory IIA component